MQSDQQPVTLAEAEEMVWRLRPARDAEPSVWVAFHRRSATVYGQVADVDTRHRHEALQCAGLEIRKARTIEHRLNPDLDLDGDDW
jgi:hypothetical protein